MKLLGVPVFVMCACVAIGCGNKDSGVGTEQSNNACPAPPQELTGAIENGDTCKTFGDCVPVCCTCPGTSGYTFLMSECHHGKCDSTEATCTDADTTGLCP
jgi:hypothetical protein